MEQTKVQNTVKTREANMELLRIVAMIMVVTLHCVGHGKLLGNSNISMGNLILLRFLDSFAQVANALFLLTSGYYMINKKFNLKRILNLWGKTLLYSYIIYIICILLGRDTQIITSLFPVTTANYWFISAYISLYFLMPIINILLNKLTQKQFKYMLITLIIMLGIIRVVSNPSGIYSGAMLPVIMIYSIGAYLRKYVEVNQKGKYMTKYILLTIIFALLYIILSVIQKTVISPNVYYRLYLILTGLREYNCILLVAMSVCVFMKFRGLHIKSDKIKKVICYLSPSMFSIYIIHENLNVCDSIWHEFGMMNYANSWLMLPYVLLVILVVFLGCLLIDLLRRGIYTMLKKVKIINKGIQKINEQIDKVNTKINCIFESAV